MKSLSQEFTCCMASRKLTQEPEWTDTNYKRVPLLLLPMTIESMSEWAGSKIALKQVTPVSFSLSLFLSLSYTHKYSQSTIGEKDHKTKVKFASERQVHKSGNF